MTAERPEPPLDRALLQLRISLANTLIVTDMIRALRPGGDHLLPHLYNELQTLQRVGGVPARCSGAISHLKGAPHEWTEAQKLVT